MQMTFSDYAFKGYKLPAARLRQAWQEWMSGEDTSTEQMAVLVAKAIGENALLENSSRPVRKLADRVLHDARRAGLIQRCSTGWTLTSMGRSFIAGKAAEAAARQSDIDACGDLHPSRYPKHDNIRKGQILGGICNITVCANTNATFWNAMTYGFYCRTCARGINFSHTDPDICSPASEKPTLAEMNQIHSQWFEQKRALDLRYNRRA